MRPLLVPLGLIVFSSASAALASESTEGSCSGADQVKLYYRQVGRGRPSAVFLHGGPGGNIESAWPDLGPLAEGRTILLYDQRGGGRSQIVKDPKLLTADAHVRDLEAIRLCHRLDKMVLIGHSWGAALAALYASAHPERVSRLLLLGPMPPTKKMFQARFEALDENSTSVLQRLAALRRALPEAEDPIRLCREFWREYLPRHFADSTLQRRRRGDACNASPDAIRNWPVVADATLASLGDWDLTPPLKRLALPALVVDGDTGRVTVASARAWAAALPDSRLILIPDSGHFPQVEQPAAFFDAVGPFLDGRWPTQEDLRRSHPRGSDLPP